MADHLVDQIAEKFRELLYKQTDAHDSVHRDRGPNFDADDDLPAIDITIGDDDPPDGQVQGLWTSVVQINVDLYASDRVENVSSTLLELRKQTYMRLMAEYPSFPVTGVNQITPGGAEPVAAFADGQVPVAYLRTVYFVTYRHSLTDPSQ